MELVAYDPDSHFDAIHRVWLETGWVETGDERQREAMAAFLSAGHGSVAILDGEAEALGHWTPGTMWYVDRPVTMCAVTAITTSRVARRQGFATALTVRALREGREAGCVIAALGIFDQGFYDRFGFGTGSYEHRFALDPESLIVDVPRRRPVRLTADDWQEIHAAMVGRYRAHGSVTLDPPEIMKAELLWLKDLFGLGFRDGHGVLTHFVAGSAKGESGPYRLQWIGYETPDQLLELLQLVKQLADQVASVVIWEPPGVQMQDFIARPLRERTRTYKAEHETSQRAGAFWQVRILDLASSIATRHWVGPELRFNLVLSDPIDAIAPETSISGDYVVTVGAGSGVEPGTGADLETLSASVNAFSRMWAGVRRASSLAVSDDLAGPPGLLRRLDEAFAVPEPHHGWFF